MLYLSLCARVRNAGPGKAKTTRPATGLMSKHVKELKAFLDEAFSPQDPK